MNDPTARSWTTLTARARSAAPPEIDVSRGIAASLAPRRAAAPRTFSESLLALSGHTSFRVAFGLAILSTAVIGYGGYTISDDLTMIFSFTL